LIRQALGALLVGAEAVREVYSDGVLVTIARAVRRTLASQQGPDGPLQDYVFATFLNGRVPGPLDFVVPSEAREVLRAGARSRERARNEAVAAMEIFSKSSRRIQPLRWWDGVVAFLIGAIVSAGGPASLAMLPWYISASWTVALALVYLALQSALIYLPIRLAQGRQLRWPILIMAVMGTLSLLAWLSLLMCVFIAVFIPGVLRGPILDEPRTLLVFPLIFLVFLSPLVWSFFYQRQQTWLLLHKFLLRWSYIITACTVAGMIILPEAASRRGPDPFPLLIDGSFSVQLTALGQGLVFAYFRRLRGIIFPSSCTPSGSSYSKAVDS
jgi:hypothetical protein